jgi:hypothetical protein
VFENRVFRRIFGPKRDKVTEEWRKQHNKELNDLYSSPNIVQAITSKEKIEMGGVCSTHGGEQKWTQGLSGETEGKRSLRRVRHRWEDNIKMIIRKWDVGTWTGLMWLRIGTGGRHL